MSARASAPVAPLLVGLVALLAGACSERRHVVGRLASDATADSASAADSSPAPIQAWGSYAATLEIPACPKADHDELVVDTAQHELEGPRDSRGISLLDNRADAGEKLSLAEALAIAANRSGRNTVLFDAEVFPATSPAMIELPEDSPLLSTPWQQTCLDGRDRGVIVRWPSEARFTLNWVFEQDSRVVGLTLLEIPAQGLTFRDSQLAGCRLQTDGSELFDSGSPFLVTASSGALVGPGNVMATPRTAVRLDNLTGARVESNDLGYDPLTQQRLELSQPFFLGSIGAEVVIEDNVIAHTDITNGLHDPRSSNTIHFRDNRIGVDREGNGLADPVGELGFAAGTYVFGPGNIVRGIPRIRVDAATVQITRNEISGTEAGIVYLPRPPFEPPTITEVTASSASGSCPVSGTIELFSDPADQGERYLDEAPCATAGGIWSISDLDLPSGQNLTATLTDDLGRTSPFSPPRPIP